MNVLGLVVSFVKKLVFLKLAEKNVDKALEDQGSVEGVADAVRTVADVVENIPGLSADAKVIAHAVSDVAKAAGSQSKDADFRKL